MKKIIENLKNKEIIYKKAIVLLKNYIQDKYRNESETYRIRVLADTIHQIIDEHITEFTPSNQRQIKGALLDKMVTEKEPDINAYDIMTLCIRLEIGGEHFMKRLKNWINREQDILVDAKTLKRITQRVKREIEAEEEIEFIEEDLLSKEQNKVLLDQLEEVYNSYNPKEQVNQHSEKLEEEVAVAVTSTTKERPVRQVSRDRQMDILKALELKTSNTLATEKQRRRHIGDQIEVFLSKKNWRLMGLVGGVVVLVVMGLSISVEKAPHDMAEAYPDRQHLQTEIQQNPTVQPGTVEKKASKKLIREIDASHLDETFKYKEINEEALQVWLNRRHSLLAEEENFQTIMKVAKLYGVNPLLLFAITGQEQNFVPENHPLAEKILNNPFNVYGSWEKFNTDLDEATRIAARTILTGSEGRPEKADPVSWLNIEGGYAEDTQWHVGVSLILEQLEIIARQGQ